MPTREAEGEWEAIERAIDLATEPEDQMAKVIAAQYFHQYSLHSAENPLTPERRRWYEENVVPSLTDNERKVLKETHEFMVKHSYKPINSK